MPSKRIQNLAKSRLKGRLANKPHATRFKAAFLATLGNSGHVKDGDTWIRHVDGKLRRIWFYKKAGMVSVEHNDGENGWDFYPDNAKSPYMDYNGPGVQSAIFLSPDALLQRFLAIL